ncbi:MAG: PqqD family peptide modification chaperone [Methanobacteriota archaeon]
MPVPRVKPMISLREEFDDWALLFNPDTGKVVGLTPTAVTIWKGMIQGHTCETIIQTLKYEFEDTPDELEEDIRSFFADTIRHGYAEESFHG